jgi:HAE1 family hydrophobic/amphiphilic exporter-1
MTLSDLSIKRPVFAWMIMFGMIVFGAIGFIRLGVSLMPDVDRPTLTVQAEWQGAAPDVIETEIADKIEEQVLTVQGITDVTSFIRQGVAQVAIEFDVSREIDSALQEVQAAISRIRFPTEVDPPIIRKSNPEDEPIMYIGVTSDERSLHDLIVYADLHIKDHFQTVQDVADIFMTGFTDRNLRLWVNNEKLKQYDLTILDLRKAIQNEHLETAAGIIENKREEMNVRTMGEGVSPEEVANIFITQRGGQPIYHTNIRIKDVARVEDGLNDVRSAVRVKGVQGIGFGIKKQRGSNAVTVAQGIKRKISELNQTLPKDIKIVVNFDTTRFIEEALHETEFTLILSVVFTALVCWLFLGSWSSTFNVLLSIPTSVMGTFLILYFAGFTLNFFTLLGLSLAIGIVVDDAIMVLENIVRHQEMGKDRINAARVGAREITFAAVAATVAVLAIFLPVAFMKGLIGKFLYQFSITISAAVALSLLEAITITPMRCSQFLSTGRNEGSFSLFLDRQFRRLSDRYGQILAFCLNWRWTVIVSAMGFFVLSLFLPRCLHLLPGFLQREFRVELVPTQDQSIFLCQFETPVGSSLTYTSEKLLEVEKFLKARPEVLRYMVAAGAGGVGVNTGRAFVTLKPPRERKLTQQQFISLCRKELKVKDLKVKIIDLSQQGFTGQRGGYPVEFNIRGPDWKVLQTKAGEIVKELNATGRVRDLDTDFRTDMPEIRIWPDRERAGTSGVTIDTVAQTISAAIGGIREGKYTQDGRRYDVRIRLEPDERNQPTDIMDLQVRTTYGELIPMKEVVRTERIPTLQTITRRMRERSISITANLAPGQSQADVLKAAEDICHRALPEGYRMYLSGNAQVMREAGQQLMLVLCLGILVAYMVLASQFNSFVHPFTVLLAMPFSISGALIALLVCNQSLNLYSGIGLVLLMGIVKKNSILLVEFTNKKRYEDGLPLQQAILTASPIRLRPILMTSMATVAAAIPPALALGPGAESRMPMAITIIGGVIVSTAFTLLVVPCAYSLFARLERHVPVSTGASDA